MRRPEGVGGGEARAEGAQDLVHELPPVGGGSRAKIGSGSEGLMEDQNWHQLRLHGLEAAASVLAGADRFGQAVGAAQAAVDADPLR